MKLEQAEKIAQSLKDELSPFCERIEIGGSIRRKKPEVKDIELVCIPKKVLMPCAQTTLEGIVMTTYSNPLFTHLKTYNVLKMGDKYAKIEVFDEHATGVRQYIKVDISTATPETWGYIFLLRTGPAEFSKFVVTELKRRGFTPREGAVCSDEPHEGMIKIATPDETAVFHLLQIADIYPEYRFKDVMWK